MIEAANRLKEINEYYFSTKLQEIASLNKSGKNIINLGIGSPDLPPHPSVIDALHKAALQPNNHQYQSYKGVEILRITIANWYTTFYNVTLNSASEILPLIGSKEGIMHICMSLLNTGDEVLIPNPGYPTYAAAITLAGGNGKYYHLEEECNWEIDLQSLENTNLSKVKMMFVNYPHMPTGASGSKEHFEKIIAFGKRNNILIVNDNPYSFILNKKPLSILQVDDALEHAIELNSLSKSHNMAGWRIGMICGSEKIINTIIRFKSNMDSGMFLPVQLAATTALQLDESWYIELNRIYKKRKETVLRIVDKLKCTYTVKQQGLFVWAKINKGFRDGYALSDKILYENNVFITPGGVFGTAGNNYIRISLCQPEHILEEAFLRIA